MSLDVRRPSLTWLMVGGLLLCAPLRAGAASLSGKDVQIAAKALGFLDPPVASGVLAVVYAAGNAASRRDADQIAASFGSGMAAGAALVTANVITTAKLAGGGAYVGIILAEGANPADAMVAARARHIPCITGISGQVQAGTCVMSVRSDPKVDITVSHAAAAASGVSFLAAFRMLIHEI